MRIGLVTSRTAAPIIKEIISDIKKESIDIIVITLPIPAISMLDSKRVAKLLEGMRSKLKGLDVLLIPGTVKGDVSIIEKAIGVTTYKATRDPGLIPRIIEVILAGGELSKTKPAEEVTRVTLPSYSYKVAFEIKGLKVPFRGPPTLLIAEIPPETENYFKLAERFVNAGADILLVGIGVSEEKPWKKIKDIVGMGIPVLTEAPSPRIASKALEEGAQGISISAQKVEKYLDSVPEDSVIIIGERDIGIIVDALKTLEHQGFHHIIVDPVVGVPLVDLSLTGERYRAALELPVPILFSAANAATQIDADTHGIYAILAAMSIELGASLFQVVEDSYKTLHSVAEAREALRLAEESWKRRGQPHLVGSKLLVVKQLEPPPPPSIKLRDPITVEDQIEPEMEKAFFIINVDHKKGLILVEYHEGGKIIQFTGKKARSLGRVITRKVEISSEHAAYLGEELYKAELALRTGRTYIQDGELFKMVWEHDRNS